MATGNKDAVSVAAYERMPIYANLKSGTTKFYLARVPSAGAGPRPQDRVLRHRRLQPGGDDQDRRPGGQHGQPRDHLCRPWFPAELRPRRAPRCPGCLLTNVQASNGYQGKAKEVDVQVPADYLCSDLVNSGCWFTVAYTYPNIGSASVQDTTTWSATLDGDPVRLVK